MRTHLRRPDRPLLALERLEDRVLLTGNVSVFRHGSDLAVEGHGLANCVELDQFGDFTVRGCDAAGSPTRVNGVANGEVTFGGAGSGDIQILLRSGNDIVRVGSR